MSNARVVELAACSTPFILWQVTQPFESVILQWHLFHQLILKNQSMGDKFSKCTKQTKSQCFQQLRESGKAPKIGKAASVQKIEEAKKKMQELGNLQKFGMINNDGLYPFCTIGRIESIFNIDHSTKWSSGVLIKDNLVLTCAHSIFNPSLSLQAETIWFYPSFNSQNKGQNRVKVEKCFIHSTYRTSKLPSEKIDKNLDYAFLLLQSNLRNQYGYMGIDFFSNLSQGQKYIMGYPTQKQDTLFIYKGQIQPKDGVLLHTMDTSPGVGGGPIVQIKDGEAFIVGIHSFGFKNGQKGGIKLTKTIKTAFAENMNKIDFELCVDEILGKKDKDFDGFLTMNWKKISIAQMNNNKIDTKRIKDLAKIDFSNIRQLELKNNRIDHIGISELIKYQWLNLQKLQLSGNQIRSKGISELKNHKWINLTKISLANCQLGDDGSRKLFSQQAWITLKQINLSSNNITAIGLKSIDTSPFTNKLSELIMDNNEIGLDGIKQFVKGDFQSLSSLSLRCCQLQKGAAEITKIISKNLKKLNLGQNQIDDETLKLMITKRQDKWSTLQQLIFDNNLVSALGIQLIIQQKWTSLKKLNFKLNRISLNNVQICRQQLRKSLNSEAIQL